MLTYLLISASSSAATRIDDWQSNWGKDKFPEMATASVGMSFLAFVAFASSSLISDGECGVGRQKGDVIVVVGEVVQWSMLGLGG
ncbi:hypothetical protein RJ639_021567 [Escallonia herrerae]|uniref:CASP-like protein n=1 Tax=Escallonia herrerae TaxID=1293975 RepID=A0AA89AFR6_9ASTE|nr:hypothetical protein RJ639_021567 [Escallonia herrerae]